MNRILLLGALSAALLMLGGCEEKERKNGAETSKSAVAPEKIKVTQGAVKRVESPKESKANSGQFYYSYNEEKKEPKKVKRTTLDAYLNIRSPYERVQIELMIQKLSKEFRIKCSPCHDDYANGVIGPSLLDKDGKYIYDQLMAFKTGKKENTLMKQLVEMNDPETLRKIADEIAEFNRKIREMRKGRS